MLVIHPDECIDCGVCVPECPAQAIFPDTEDVATPFWLELNKTYSERWPNIMRKGQQPADAKDWDGVPDKYSRLFSAEAGND